MCLVPVLKGMFICSIESSRVPLWLEEQCGGAVAWSAPVQEQDLGVVQTMSARVQPELKREASQSSLSQLI